MKYPNAVKCALFVVAVSFVTLLVASRAAYAATATATLGVSATVQATCLISATAMAFGTYTAAVATSASAISATCTNTTPYNIGLSAGLWSGATVNTRSMTGPASALPAYALFSDSARTANWGQTIGTDTVTGTGNGSAQTINVYGQAGAAQYLAPGSYAYTITATVAY